MTTELKPGTPEYDEAYKKEMQRLEAEASDGKKEAKDESNTSEVKDEAKAETKTDDGKKDETLEELKTRLDEERKARERLEKSLKDTQRWAHQSAGMVKKLQKEADERKRSEAIAADPLVKANPGLEDTIKRVAGAKDETSDPKESWLSSVSRAIPDVETLLGDQGFFAKAKARQAELGPDWDDPFVAIRELSELKVAHLSERRTQAAVEAARKDFEAKSKKRSAMEVPGGSGGKDAQRKDDAAERYRSMSKEDFEKERARVMGY